MSGKPVRYEMAAEMYSDTATEAQFQAAVVELATALGWLVIHVRNMYANQPGIPDLLLFRDNRYVLAELKTESGKVSNKQTMWHERAAASGVTVHVWRPSDFDEVQEVLQ